MKGVGAILGRGPRGFTGGTVGIALAALGFGGVPALAGAAAYRVGPIREVSACRGQNAEVEEAADPTGKYVYLEWIGCKGIGFARSTDGGARFRRPISLPGSGGAWDPAIAVSPTGTVYAAFMVTRKTKTFPVVASSFNHGRTFPRLTALLPPRSGNWGDRDFIATGSANTVYLTWDYGPSASNVRLDCPSNGSCAITGGELNVVMQTSTNGGNSFGPMRSITPGYPASGADSAPLVVEPSGRVDVLYTRYRVTNRQKDTLGRGNIYFTSSADGGLSWSKPVTVGRSAGTISQFEWWIDGAIGDDAAGDLYATWDTQRRHGDRAWLSYSKDHGLRWSAPIRVTPEHAKRPHIVQVAGGAPGIAYVGWLAERPGRGYGEYLRTFSIARGWLSGPRRVSRRFGNPRVWPGDTFGIATISPDFLGLSWGSATPPTRGKSEIFAARVRLNVR